MTPQQSKAFAFIRAYTSEHNHSPNFQEIADALGLKSASGVNRIVKAIAEAGKVRWRPGCARSVEVVEKNGLTPLGEKAARNVIAAYKTGDLRSDDIAYLEAALCLESAL